MVKQAASVSKVEIAGFAYVIAITIAKLIATIIIIVNANVAKFVITIAKSIAISVNFIKTYFKPMGFISFTIRHIKHNYQLYFDFAVDYEYL